MKQLDDTIGYRRLRAPREDGQALFEPPNADWNAILRQNSQQRRRSDCQLHGYWLSDLQAEARHLLLQKAQRFTAQYRVLPDPIPGPDAPIILVGHQPELVHPGVWFKNFVLSEFASQTTAHAVNLLVDNDTVRSTSLRVPSGTVDDPTLTTIPLDQPSTPIPFEERRVLDPQLFSSSAQRICDRIKSLVADPLVEQLWPVAVDAMKQHGNYGRAIAQARHTLEASWGLSTLELPLSHVCDDWPFRWFAVHLLAEASRLRDVHNQSLREYRDVNKIRSHTHPVPDLAVDGDWVEAPFWLWTVDQPVRKPAFVRQGQDCIELTDRSSIRTKLLITPGSDANRSVSQLEEMHESGIRLRPRAIITTMFARLVASDVFIHGIGGAKYDQLTDAIIRRFFEIDPLEHLVVSATLKLPVSRQPIDAVDINRIDRMQRDLTFHPENHVDLTPETERLIAEKQRWIGTELPRGQRLERHRHIVGANTALQKFLEPHREQLVQEREHLRWLAQKQAILGSRDYAFCLFSEASLRPRLLELSRQES